MLILKQFFSVVLLASLIDAIWIGGVANSFYLNQIGEFARTENGKFSIVYWAAVGVYLAIALAIVALALPLANGRVGMAFVYGAVLGFAIYGTYDFTNHATLKHWPVVLVVVDIAWGTFLCGITTAATEWMSLRWF